MGEVISNPVNIDDFNNPFWMDSKSGKKMEFTSRCRYVEKPSLPIWVGGLFDDFLLDLSVARAQGGTVFKVTDDQVSRLLEIIDGWPLDTDNQQYQPKRDIIEVSRICRDTEILKRLKKLYGNKCQICGNTITLQNRAYSECHHIKPLGEPHNGFDIPSNILVLCPNHHVEFDYGAIAINPDNSEILSLDSTNKYLGGKINIKPGHVLDNSFLEYHLSNIFSRQ